MVSGTESAGPDMQSDKGRSANTTANTNTMQRSLFKEGGRWASPGKIGFHFLTDVVRCGPQALLSLFEKAGARRVCVCVQLRRPSPRGHTIRQVCVGAALLHRRWRRTKTPESSLLIPMMDSKMGHASLASAGPCKGRTNLVTWGHGTRRPTVTSGRRRLAHRPADPGPCGS